MASNVHNGPVPVKISLVLFQVYQYFSLNNQQLNSNRGPLISESTGLPAVPQPLSNAAQSFQNFPRIEFCIS